MTALDAVTLSSHEAARMFDRTCAAGLGRGESLLDACQFTNNFVTAAISPFMAATGGYLPILFWGAICASLYLKYRNMLYPMMVGFPILVMGVFALPDHAGTFISTAMVFAVFSLIYFMVKRVTKD